jgi:hypothetical protein
MHTKTIKNIENKNININENENENETKSLLRNKKEFNDIKNNNNNYNYNPETNFMHMNKRNFDSNNINLNNNENLNMNINTYSNGNSNSNINCNNNRLSLEKIDNKRNSFIKDNIFINKIDWNFSPKFKKEKFSSVFLIPIIQDNFKKTSNNGFSPFSKNNNNNNTNGKNFNETLPIKTTQNFFNYLKSTSYNIKNKSNSNNLNKIDIPNTTNNKNDSNIYEKTTINDFSKTMSTVRNSNFDWKNFLGRMSTLNLNLQKEKSKNEENIQFIVKNFKLN